MSRSDCLLALPHFRRLLPSSRSRSCRTRETRYAIRTSTVYPRWSGFPLSRTRIEVFFLCSRPTENAGLAVSHNFRHWLGLLTRGCPKLAFR